MPPSAPAARKPRERRVYARVLSSFLCSPELTARERIPQSRLSLTGIHRHTRITVSMVILNPTRLAVKINQHDLLGYKMSFKARLAAY